MASTKQKVKKNILDIEHQRYLTYFNISIVFAVTSAFTTFISFLTEKINFLIFTFLISTIITVSLTSGIVFRNKMNEKLNEIRKL